MTPSTQDRNREGWLTEVAERLRPTFSAYTLGPFRLTCGWPCRNALSDKVRRVGECHAIESSKGGVHEIFISPYLEKPMEVAGTVAHELAHVAAGLKAGHSGMFVRVCKYVGLTKGKPKEAMPGKELADRLLKLLEPLGPYPHSRLQPVDKLKETAPTELRLRCARCGCRVVISIKWEERAGRPVCGCGGPFDLVIPEEKED